MGALRPGVSGMGELHSKTQSVIDRAPDKSAWRQHECFNLIPCTIHAPPFLSPQHRIPRTQIA